MILDRTVELELTDAGTTARLGAALSAMIRSGEAILLTGPLGAGKSVLARGLIQALAGA